MGKSKNHGNQIWKDCHDVSKSIIKVAMRHEVSAEYIWHMVSQTLQNDVFKLADSAEWIRKKKCAFCDRDGYHRIKLCSGSEKEIWVCPEHAMFVEDMLDKEVKKCKKK